MGWTYWSITKLQWRNRWSLGMNKYFYATHYWAGDYLSVPGLKLNRVSKRGHRWIICLGLKRHLLFKCSWTHTGLIKVWLTFNRKRKIITFRLILNNKRKSVQHRWYECQMFQELFSDLDVAMLYMSYTGLESCSNFFIFLMFFRGYGGSFLAIRVNVCYQLCI